MAIYPGPRTSPYHKPIDADDTLFYPESDGNPIADNTTQYEWIATIKGNLDGLFADRSDVFVAGDLLWYPVRGDIRTRVAPDVLVAFGRPKGPRGAYIQHREENIPPQVVFEILSPGNTKAEMHRKREFYERHGVEEYYSYDPDTYDFEAWIREEGQLRVAFFVEEWLSPRLGVRFIVRSNQELQLLRPNGVAFRTFGETIRKQEQAEAEREQAQWQAFQSNQRAEAERQRAKAERERAEAFAARLRELGINPDELVP